MSDPDAGGRKARTARDIAGDTECELHRQIAAFTAELENCLQAARSVGAADDDRGHARAGEVANALALGRASAKLALAMSKLQGQVNHNFTYNHATKPVELRFQPLYSLREDVPEEAAERARRNRIMDAATDRYYASSQAEAAGTSPSPESSRFE
ncbi:MAG: hypothetical protein ACREHE_11880 [Rhizomicrobium sp.]